MDTVIQWILLNTIGLSLIIIIILMTKIIFNKHISVKTHYKIWYFLFVPLIASLLPWKYFRLGEGTQYIKRLLFFNNDTTFKSERISGLNDSFAPNTDLLHDFTVSVNHSTPDFVYDIFFTVWVVGMVISIGFVIYSNYQIYQIKKSATSIKDQKIIELLEDCKEVVGVKRKIMLQETSLITSPITFGILQPYILLPIKTQEVFTLSEIKYVFLHELNHHKSKDVIVNFIMSIFQIIYWFNPFIWYALKRIRIDRELACDVSVLNLLDESGYIEYGHTIIHFVNKKYDRTNEQFALGIGGAKKQIKQRIQNIANFSGDSQLLKWKSKFICVVLGIFVLFITPITTVLAAPDDVFHFNKKNTIYEDLSTYFNGYKGSFVLYDASKKQYQIYNREMSEQRISPNSTYKIYSGLFALETNVISTNNNEQIWDRKINPYKEWNKNHNLSTALGSSVNWYFQNIDQEVGKKQLQYYFEKVKYGNEDLSGNMERYWMESSLKISPIEQVQLLYALEENKFGFKEQNIRAVKKAILIDEQKNGQFYGKTGTGTINGKNVNGWFVGFVKKGDKSYYFAINIQNKDGQASGSKAVVIAKQILHDKNIY